MDERVPSDAMRYSAMFNGALLDAYAYAPFGDTATDVVVVPTVTVLTGVKSPEIELAENAETVPVELATYK